MSPLRTLLDDYLTLRRARGFKLEREGKLLPQFLELLAARGSEFITTKLALEWATQTSTTHKCRAKRLHFVRSFSEYARAFDVRTEIPARGLITYAKARLEPYVYSDEDLDRLLEAARALPGPLMGATYTTLLGLLAVTGMRVEEGIGLDRDDVDMNQGVITVRRGKFGKSRQIPVHPSTVQALQAYSVTSNGLFRRPGSASFFLSQAGTRLIYKNVHFKFHQLIDAAGLADHRPHRPRIHDLRHSFAVRTVISWYRAGLEIAPRMPVLSTYLGHVSPAMTYWYLTATPELMALARERAERAQASQP